MPASTSEPRRSTAPHRHGAVLAALLGLGLLGAGCQAVLSLFEGSPGGPRFPHAIHLEEALDCTDCHAGAEEAASAGLPESTNGCMLCHKQIDEDKPVERTIAAFLQDGAPIWLARDRTPPADVRFDHAAHYEADVECGTCHEQIVEGEGSMLRLRGGKATCLACHAKTERGTECSVCHQQIRRDEMPASHGAAWMELHGGASRVRIAGLGETTCEQCHEENGCTQCHQQRKPQSHNQFWRLGGHGLTAAIDRSSCKTCHTTDSCVRCHQVSEPRSHRGSWGPPGNRHCRGCHLPAGPGLGCGTCHAQFPAHPVAFPPPGNLAHATARSPNDCLACHVTLSHPNPGGDCRTCHR